MNDAIMPRPYQLGQHMQATMGHAALIAQNDHYAHMPERKVMGFRLPTWQRPLVWTTAQMIRLIESIWRGVPIGTYSYVQNDDPATDGLLIDGQQRMASIEMYLAGGFPVLGHRWGDLTKSDHRAFMSSRQFPCYVVNSSDETFLRGYYDLMNFGGVAHVDGQQASALPVTR